MEIVGSLQIFGCVRLDRGNTVYVIGTENKNASATHFYRASIWKTLQAVASDHKANFPKIMFVIFLRDMPNGIGKIISFENEFESVIDRQRIIGICIEFFKDINGNVVFFIFSVHVISFIGRSCGMVNLILS